MKITAERLVAAGFSNDEVKDIMLGEEEIDSSWLAEMFIVDKYAEICGKKIAAIDAAWEAYQEALRVAEKDFEDALGKIVPSAIKEEFDLERRIANEYSP